jgi:Fe-S-cluster formation regulator IscX/YfhJ|tara:strand:- start:648 stop:920 length:273 start_codon:yes stop_codon:yes gene_type:complete
MNAMKLILITTTVIICCALMGCEPDNYKDVRDYFDDNKIGSSPDYGIFKDGHDYVITVHGFSDDLDMCNEIVTMMNRTEPNTYSCKPLNH